MIWWATYFFCCKIVVLREGPLRVTSEARKLSLWPAPSSRVQIKNMIPGDYVTKSIRNLSAPDSNCGPFVILISLCRRYQTTPFGLELFSGVGTPGFFTTFTLIIKLPLMVMRFQFSKSLSPTLILWQINRITNNAMLNKWKLTITHLFDSTSVLSTSEGRCATWEKVLIEKLKK